MQEWWGHEVDLSFAFLNPDEETDALAAAGLDLIARLDREPHEGVEYPSRRSYLLVRRCREADTSVSP